MNDKSETILSTNKFGDICRTCLKHEENMVDIFESGIVNQVIDLTNLKVSLDDKLPKTLCLNCSIQVDCLFKFQQQAKSSDTYLRSLLENERCDEVKSVLQESPKQGQLKETLLENEKLDEVESVLKESPKQGQLKKTLLENEQCDEAESVVKELPKQGQLKKKRQTVRKKNNSKSTEKDQMYLIVVPEVDKSDSKENSEIFIKDINCDHDNVELSQLCKNLIRNDFSDHTYHQKHPIYQHSEKDCDTTEIQSMEEESQHQSESVSPVKIEPVYNDAFKQNKVFDVNVVIFKCDLCKESYEEITDLSNHYLVRHGKEPLISDCSYKCPICSYNELDKEEFFRHLQNHKSEGFLFHKVNFSGEKIPLKENDGHVFVDPSLEVNTLCKIFKLNLEMLKCTVCDELIESRSAAPDHLKQCTSNEEVKPKVYIKQTCPVCQLSFLNEEDKYIRHLISHKEENVLYIKVDNTWQPVEVADDDQLFIPHSEAVEIIKTLSSNILVKTFHVYDVNSCSSCDYVAESYELLSEHCQVVHEEVLKEPSMVCPVCVDDFNIGSVDECKAKYYKHLMIHRSEGVAFVEMKNNGSVSSFNQTYSNLFTQSSILCGLANASLSVCFPKIWHSELIIFHKKKKRPYKCDICKKLFSHKHDIVKHIECHETKYMCERCGKTISGNKKYTNHILMHLNSLKKSGRKPTCSVCNKKFANRASLNGHLKYHISEGIKTDAAASFYGIMCDKCGKGFINNSGLAKHKKMHATDKENSVLKCQICDKDFSRQRSFDRHKSAHFNPKYLECAICKLPLSTSASLEKHMEQHKSDSQTYDCNSCKISFLSKDALRAHQTHTGHYIDRKPFECNVCHEKFYLGRNFAQHIKTHPKYKMGECTLCGKRLATVQSLALHMGRHFEANSILCPHCGKRYYEERNYHRHLLTHKGVKPFTCDVENCGKSFYTFFELNRHKKYHLNKRDFGCSYCSKTFHEANHLTVHIRTHTGERPYTCPHCNKGFVTRSRCKQHIKLIHQGIGYEMIQSSISKKVTVFENEHKTQTIGMDIV